MARWGFRKMTMDDLAKEAGVSKRTIYTYFRTKEEVGLSSIARVVEGVHEHLEQLASGPALPSEKLHAMLSARVLDRVRAVQDFFQSLDELFEVVRPAYMARRAFYFEREVQLIAKVLDQGVSSGDFVALNAAETARTLLLATNAYLPYSLSVRELGDLESIQHGVDSMATLLIRGITAPRETVMRKRT